MGKFFRRKVVSLSIFTALAVLWWGNLALSFTSLRWLAQRQDLYIGTAVQFRPLQRQPMYRKVLVREFNMVTPENAMKFEVVHPERDHYDFTQADEIVQFARDRDLLVRGHTLVWHQQLPSWLTEGEFTREELKAILRDHIYTVVGHFRDRVSVWDVVNEAFNDDGTLRDTIWLRGIGEEYLELAFRWASEADPNARLFYNNYGGEMAGKKADETYEFMQKLQDRGVPIDGVGLQMHVGLNNAPTAAAVAENMRRFDRLGLEVQITEMDVQIQNGTGTTGERLHAQAEIYGEMLRVCQIEPNCNTLVMWGFTDAHSWIPSFTGNDDSPLIFDEFYRPKPAYYELVEVLSR